MLPQDTIDRIIEQATFRRNVYNLIPQGATRILDFGCGDGSLLLRLQRDKACSELFGVEVDPKVCGPLHQAIDGLFHVNIEQGLGELAGFQGYFNHIVLHDVVEHLYDPWFTLTKIRSLLAADGRIIVATPNLHHWRLQYKIHQGLFPYGPGLWHTGHLRWYTPLSLIELLLIGGLRMNAVYLEIPDQVDFSHLAAGDEVRTVRIPPPEFEGRRGYEHPVTLTYDQDVRKYYPVFYAHKLIAECGKGELLFDPVPITYNCPMLEALRKAIDLPFDIYNPPPMRALIGNWH